MKQRSDGRWAKKKTIDGELVYFYSSADTEKQAIKDIENQMLKYSTKMHNNKHNFRILSERMMEFHSEGVGYKTIETYSVALKHLAPFNKYDIEEITPSMVQNLIDTMAKKENYSFSSIAKVKIVFGLIVDFAIVHENLPLNNFTKSIKVPKGIKKGKVSAPPDFVSKTIIENADKLEFGMWAMCLLCTGLRRGELAALQRKDIDLDYDLISVSKSVIFVHNQPQLKSTPKTDASIGTVPILQILKPHISKLCENLAPDEFLFGRDKPLTETMIKKRWTKYCAEIGYTFNIHQLRHAYAKMIYKAGIDAKTAQRLLRHADFTTTMNIYTDFSNEMTNKSVDALNNFLTTF